MSSIALGPTLLRYGVVFILTVIAITVIFYLLETFFGFGSNSGAAVVSTLVPALDAGHNIVRKTGQRLPSGEAWTLSALFMMVNIAIGMIPFAILAGAGHLGEMFSAISLSLLIVILLVVAGIHLLATRFFLGMGMKQAEKAAHS